MLIKNAKQKLLASFKFDKLIAKRFHDIRYYVGRSDNYKHYLKREQQRAKLSTPKNPMVTTILEKYKELGQKKINQANLMLKKIALRNVVRMVEGETPPVHTNLMGLVTSVPLMIQAYTKIRKNQGALTRAASMSPAAWDKMNPLKKRYLLGTLSKPDGISLQTIHATSYLLRKGIYPWGASRRIYIPKPGSPEKKRPLTIPPFMDRIVQQNIKTILETIYEPWFDKLNCSFGFRPGKGVHNAIIKLTQNGTEGEYMALEGDVEAAYDKVNKNILLKILSERINDKKFLKLMEERLKYLFFDSESQKYVSPIDGIPQGGIDSPYLYNIYMSKFDEWIVGHLHQKKLQIESQVRVNRHTKNTTHAPTKPTSIPRLKEKTMLKGLIQRTKKKMKLQQDKDQKYAMIKEIRNLQHRYRKLPSQDKARAIQRFTYVRYADDWIILTNASKPILEQIKKEIKEWLKANLDATLSEPKTLTTDMRKSNAHFLGFELKYTDSRKLEPKYNQQANRMILSKVAGAKIRTFPDKSRLINRFYMKGYCDQKGNPLTIPWLSCMEPYMIIDKYNAVIAGFANYYGEFVYNKRTLNRWIYILRFSCIKTLAQKYKTSTRKIFAKYKVTNPNYRLRYGKTIEIKLRIKYKDDQIFEKPYRLMTYLEALQKAIDINQKPRYEMVTKTLDNKQNYLTYLRYFDTIKSGLIPKPLDKDYLNRIKWINWRTSCSFNMPCCICGAMGNVEMHHVKHVRKRRYSIDEKPPTWEQIMGLKNRKQIPVCRKCHMDLIHSGKYNDINLKLMGSRPLVDNRIVNVENFIRPGAIEHYQKTLEEKGFRKIQPKDKEP